jgi:UDP-glucose 4-epimerase
VTMNYWNLYGQRELRGLFSLTMRILITGGFGFVGGRLAVHLAQAGHQIILGTRHSMTVPDWLPQANVVKIAWDDEIALERSCNGVDVIIHAAGMNAQDCIVDPVAALAFNGLSTAKLVLAASRASVKKFIYLSTAHVYANPLVGIITEETCPSNLHPYATSHLAGENAVLSASNLGELQGIVLRLSNAFGAPMHKDVNCWMLLVNDLCKQALQTRKLVLQTSGLQQRDFISLTDVCQTIEMLVIVHTEFKQVNVFNVGEGVSQSVLEMAQLIQQRCLKVLGFKPELQHKQGGFNEQHLSLNYRTDRLNSLGISCKNLSCVEEIDSLLRFCQDVFSQKSQNA